jgi:hypothetical protein
VFCIVVTMKHFLSATFIYDSGKSSSSLLSMGPASPPFEASCISLTYKQFGINEISGSHCGDYEGDSFWDVAPCNLVEVFRRFRVSYCLHRIPDNWVCTSETSVYNHETTRRYIPESCHLHKVNGILGYHDGWYETTAFSDVMTCSLLEVYWRFRGIYCLLYQGGKAQYSRIPLS